RRRHTRFSRDWSSDVCSSDLLISEGCRRIMHVTGDLRRNVYAGRLDGYRQALNENGIAIDESLIMVTDLSLEAGRLAAEKLVERSEERRVGKEWRSCVGQSRD